MPRNSSGTYSLPAGNPVVTGTVISSTWANTTLSDIGAEITDSLDRSGKGGMLAALQLFSGVVGAPGLSWTAETTSGLYRAGAGDFRYSISSADKLQITASLLKSFGPVFELENSAPIIQFDETDAVADERNWLLRSVAGVFTLSTANDAAPTTPVANALSIDRTGTTVAAWTFGGSTFTFPGPVLLADGAVGAPALSFSGDTDIGIYRAAANIGALAAGGVASAVWSTQGFGVNVDGSAATPGLYFHTDQNTGFFRLGADQLAVAAGGTNIADFEVLGLVMRSGSIYIQNGTAGTPGLALLNDQDTGIYFLGANQLGFSAGGTLRFDVESAGAVVRSGQFFIQDGSIPSPAWCFLNDQDTGMYLSGSNDVSIICGATIGFRVQNITGNLVCVIGNNSSTTHSINTLTATSASTGANGATPAQVDGYITIAINSATKKIPYYNT